MWGEGADELRAAVAGVLLPSGVGSRLGLCSSAGAASGILPSPSRAAPSAGRRSGPAAFPAGARQPSCRRVVCWWLTAGALGLPLAIGVFTGPGHLSRSVLQNAV